MANPIYLFMLAFLLVALIAYNYKISDALEFYITEKKRETKSTESAMNEIIKKLRDQLRFLTIGVKNSKKEN